MNNIYITLLWTDEKQFDLKEHKTLKEAITYLIKNGAKYENQKIVKEISWLPENENTIMMVPAGTEIKTIKSKDPVEEALANKPNPTGPPIAQPTTIDMTKKNLKPGSSIFDKVIPPQMRTQFTQTILNDD